MNIHDSKTKTKTKSFANCDCVVHRSIHPSTMNQAPRPMTSEDFQAMIPSHFLSGGKNYELQKASPAVEQGGSAVTVTVKKGTPDMPMLPPAPTELGQVTETITKSTFTETVMTRITDNRLGEPLISEVYK